MSTRLQHPHRVIGSHTITLGFDAQVKHQDARAAPNARRRRCRARAIALVVGPRSRTSRRAPRVVRRTRRRDRRAARRRARARRRVAGAARSGPTSRDRRAAARRGVWRSACARAVVGCRRLRLPRRRGRRVGLGRPRAADAAAGPVALGEDVLPGHPQCFGRPRGRRLHLHQARRPPRHGRGPCRTAGWTLLYDPERDRRPAAGVLRVGWSPVNAARRWDGALIDGRRHGRRGAARRGRARARAPHDGHWSERATSLLAPLLHAAAIDDAPMAAVLHWVDRHDGSHPLSVLAARVGEDAPAHRRARRDPGDRRPRAVRHLVDGVGRPRAPTARAARWPRPSRRTSTPRRSAPAPTPSTSAPAGASSTCGRRSWWDCSPRCATPPTAAPATAPGGPPVLLALDEAANIAPIPDLPAMVSEGAGQGLLTLASLQDLSQARRRWGRQGDAFLSLFGTTVVLPGIADLPTLQAISALAGDEEVPTRTVATGPGHDGRRRPSVSWSTVHRPRLPVDAVGRGQPGDGPGPRRRQPDRLGAAHPGARHRPLARARGRRTGRGAEARPGAPARPGPPSAASGDERPVQPRPRPRSGGSARRPASRPSRRRAVVEPAGRWPGGRPTAGPPWRPAPRPIPRCPSGRDRSVTPQRAR